SQQVKAVSGGRDVAEQHSGPNPFDSQQGQGAEQNCYEEADGCALDYGGQLQVKRDDPGQDRLQLPCQSRQGDASQANPEEASGKPEADHLDQVDQNDSTGLAADAFQNCNRLPFLLDEHTSDTGNANAAQHQDYQADQ